MSLVILLIGVLLTTVAFILANVFVWLPTRNMQKANHVKKGQTRVLILSAIAYAIVLVVLFYAYSTQIL